MTSLTMHINGMTCGHCIAGVKRALAQLPGIEVQEVAIGSARVRFDEQAIPPAQVEQQLAKAVEDEGYQVVSTS